MFYTEEKPLFSHQQNISCSSCVVMQCFFSTVPVRFLFPVRFFNVFRRKGIQEPIIYNLLVYLDRIIAVLGGLQQHSNLDWDLSLLLVHVDLSRLSDLS